MLTIVSDRRDMPYGTVLEPITVYFSFWFENARCFFGQIIFRYIYGESSMCVVELATCRGLVLHVSWDITSACLSILPSDLL